MLNTLITPFFFQANKWKKRGMTIVPMRYDHTLNNFALKMQCLVSVYAGDGTISVSSAGIEMGQGLNTKVKQIFCLTMFTDFFLYLVFLSC